jgi:hypothetical protein
LQKDDHRRRWWRDVATLAALGGLLLALIFNTISVRQGTKQASLQAEQARQAAEEARRTRLHTQIGMLTSLSAYLQEADLALAATPVERYRCDPTVPISERDRLRVLAQVQSYDLLAWLFNRRLWELSAAETYWRIRMLKALAFAEAVWESPGVSEQFAELHRFRQALPGEPEPIPCPR